MQQLLGPRLRVQVVLGVDAPAARVESAARIRWSGPATSAANTRLSLDQPAARFAAFSSDTAASAPNRWLNHASSRARVSARSRWMSAMPAMPPDLHTDGSDVNDRFVYVWRLRCNTLAG